MATPKTGRPRGRPKGAKNKRTAQREAAVKEAAAKIEEALPQAFEGDAHAFLMSVYKDQQKPIDLRVDAAKVAIRYEKPALAAVSHSGELRTTAGLTDEELAAIIEAERGDGAFDEEEDPGSVH